MSNEKSTTTHNLKVYKDTKQFWLATSSQLKQEEAKNSLFLGVSYIFTSNPTNCIYQSALFQGDQLLGALMCSKVQTHYNILVSPVNNKQTAEELLKQAQKSNTPINNIIGENITVEQYKKILSELGKETQLTMTQGIYKCTKVIPPAIPKEITFRLATQNDVSTIAKWIEYFHIDATPHKPPIDCLNIAKNKIEKKSIFVIESNGEPVSMAASARDLETSCSVNSVFTPRKFRKKGYGSIVTALLTQHLFDSGKKEINLYTDMKNPTSNKIYQDIGYELVCNSTHITVKS